jgi:hypothetical protein
MNITLEVKTHYGTQYIYPVCDTAAKLTALTGKKTLATTTLKKLSAWVT